ncbi:HupE/UreJ family protein [Bradyrhizobium sp. WD16]|uniref:HupE/UreJ family protein n=1 Tax=Bradyrhizobium sp. WD16 TaxID=1521768 RepID=UPI0020A45029|nr:HupE/UreJ family protein [Bradyrhizobium sp. WD16]UTD26256.1 hypothetical protein DB459_04270 [Bradyrhizobium sp. WD16]
MKKLSYAPLAVAMVLVAASPALAHTGDGPHSHGFVAGLMHPLGGADHALAMLAIGIWSALVGGPRAFLAPLTFVLAMLAGAALGHAGIALPMVDVAIAASVLVLGLLILTRLELPTAAGMALVALFAVFHGHAHGTEASGAIAAYMAGFALTTAGLHVAGMVFGRIIMAQSGLSRLLGGAIAAAGAYLIAAQ